MAHVAIARLTTLLLFLSLIRTGKNKLSSFLLGCHSFQPSLSSRSPSSLSSSRTSSSLRRGRKSSYNTLFYKSDRFVEDEEETKPHLSFEERMRSQMAKRMHSDRSSTRKFSDSSTGASSTTSPSTSLLPDIRTLDDYKFALDRAKDEGKMLAVFWYSPWCKGCRDVRPGMGTLAKRHRDAVNFIRVPVLEENANLHRGLNVPSVPHMHLYAPDHPDNNFIRLVEESKMTRKRLPAFQKLLRDYEAGWCSLEEMGIWSTSCPYAFRSNFKNKLG